MKLKKKLNKKKEVWVVGGRDWKKNSIKKGLKNKKKSTCQT
jgi:hypothetical protein